MGELSGWPETKVLLGNLTECSSALVIMFVLFLKTCVPWVSLAASSLSGLAPSWLRSEHGKERTAQQCEASQRHSAKVSYYNR